jgi:hypothetical protein
MSLRGQKRRDPAPINSDLARRADILSVSTHSAGDEVYQCARPDDAGDPKNEVCKNQEYNGIDDRYPEDLMRRIGRSPRNYVTQLKELNRDNDRRVDCGSHHQIDGKRKAAEPRTHRTLQDEQRDASERDTRRSP